MAQDPVLPLYYNDISTSTQDWSDEEFGAYVRLLIHQWRQGGLPNDYQRLTRIATSLDRNWSLLKDKFKEVDGLLKNEYMEDVRTKRAKHKQKQKENVAKRYQNSTKHHTKSVPLEIENENEIEKELEKEEESVEKIEEAFFIKNDFDDNFISAFDPITCDRYKTVYGHLDLAAELKAFRVKCDNDPKSYHSRDVPGLRTAFQYQLQNSKNKINGNRKQSGVTAEGTRDRLNRYSD